MGTNITLYDSTGHFCGSMLQCYLTIFSVGIRRGGGIADDLLKRPWVPFDIFIKRFFYDMTFHLLILLIMLNVIISVIIDTFSDLRIKHDSRIYDVNNTCFICGLNRLDFEEKRIKFNDHVSHEHNIWNYVYFIYNLKQIPKNDMNFTQTHVSNMIDNKKINWFPILKYKESSN